MSRWWKRRPVWMWLVGLTMGLLVGVGMMIGTLVAVNHTAPSTVQWPETLLHATASHSGESFAMASGVIDEDIEGLFTLDYLTGELQCWVLYTRAPNPAFGGVFKHNVLQDLGVQQGKGKPNYVMVTGQANFQRGAGAMAPAGTVVYVADGNTGNFAAYTIFWNRTAARSLQAHQGPFTLLATGKARTLEIRE